MPKVAVVIPARYASTRLPGKPLISLAGKPLIQHVWERCQKARGVDAVIIATDDRRIAEAARSFGGEVAMTSAKHRSGSDRIAEVARKNPHFTHLINVQGDEPLVDPQLISRLATRMLKDRQIEMITAATDFADEAEVANPNAVKVVVSQRGEALYFSRSAIPFLRADGVRPTWHRHLGIYGYTARLLLQYVKWKPTPLELAESLEQLRALENGTRIHVVPSQAATLGVDTPADVVVVEKMLAAAKPARKSARRKIG